MGFAGSDNLVALSIPVCAVTLKYFPHGFVDFEAREATEDGATDLPEPSERGKG